MNKKQNITFRLDKETMDSVKYIKEKTSINLSKLLRTMINDLVEKEKKDLMKYNNE